MPEWREECRGRSTTAEDIASAHHFVNHGSLDHGAPPMSVHGERRFVARVVRDGYEMVAVFNERRHVLVLHDLYTERKRRK